MKTLVTSGLVVLVAAAIGCASKKPVETNYERPLKAGEVALRKITDPSRIPDFTEACLITLNLRESVQNSLNYLKKPSSRKTFPSGPVTHDMAVASLQAFTELLDANLTPAQMNQTIRQKFDVYESVGCDDLGTVLFTAYYTPLFEASLTKTEKFRYPLYKQPAGLVKNPDGTPSNPMPDRRTIETQDLYAGSEMVWMADPFEAYVAHIQGSARLRLTDGSEITVGYAANNGHEYKSIRAELVRQGKIARRAGLPSMLEYFRLHPAEVQAMTWLNPRFVFFTLVADGRPRGCLNEPVTPLRSIATDKKIFPAACLTFIATRLPQRYGLKILDVPYTGFALDQDAGGAIRAPGRCDVYVGAGPDAGELAGRAQNEGKLYYLFVKAGAK